MPGSTTSIDDLRKLFLLGSMLDYTRFTEVRCGGQYIYIYTVHMYMCVNPEVREVVRASPQVCTPGPNQTTASSPLQYRLMSSLRLGALRSRT